MVKNLFKVGNLQYLPSAEHRYSVSLGWSSCHDGAVDEEGRELSVDDDAQRHEETIDAGEDDSKKKQQYLPWFSIPILWSKI